MANNGSFTTNGYENRVLKFSWSLASQSVANNTSTINWSLDGSGGANNVYYMAGDFKVVINGTTVYSSSPRIKLFNTTNVASGSIQIPHKDDGSKSFSASVTASIYTFAVDKSGSGSWSLPTIARASQPSCITWPNTTPNIGNIGSTITIHMNRKSSIFTHTVRYSFGNLSGTIATNVGDNCRWTIPTSFYAQIPNANSGTGTIYADTYNGSTLIGTKSVSFTCNVANSNPTFNCSYLDTNTTTTNITNNNQLIIRNNSVLKINLTNVQPKNSASLSKAAVTINGVTFSTNTFSNGTATLIVGTLNISSNVTAVVTVTDSRGNTTSQNLPIQILNWVLPSAIITLKRQNNFYSTTYLTVDGDYSYLNGLNVMTIQYRYKKVSDTNYSAYTTITDNTQVSFDADNLYEWDIQVLVSDKIGNTVYNLTLQKGIPLMFFDTINNSVGINCLPKYANSFEANGVNFNSVTLYNSINGTNGTVTLSDNASSYSYLEIYYRTNDNYYNFTKVYSPNGKSVSLSGNYPYSDEGVQICTYSKETIVKINSNTITPVNYAEVQIISGSNGRTNITNSNNIYITQVVGYR